jgi:hypothetical protein
MPWPRKRRVPALDVLEQRQLLSATVPANTLEIVQGNVASSGAGAEVSVPVTAHNINGRIPIVIGTATSPTEGSTLLPQVVAAIGPNGKRLALQQGAPYNARTHNEATAFVQVGTPGTVTLEVTGAQGTFGSFQLREYLPGDINGDGQVTYADLAAFPKYYRTQAGDANYNPAADANLNGQIGQDDARALVRNLNPGVPRTPLQINLFLTPRKAVKGHVPSNSGGHTYYQTVTIKGRTTPGSIVFFDSSLGDYSFEGGAAATNAKGDFSVTSKHTQGINNNDFLVISPFGQQKIQDYPVYYFPGVFSRTIKARPAVVAGSSTPAATSGTGAAKGLGTRSHFEVLPAGTP